MTRSKWLLPFMIIMVMASTAVADQIYAVVHGDTATIWQTGTSRNCCSLFRMDVSLTDYMITVTEVDTAADLCLCTCVFDLAVTIGPLIPGAYTVEVFSFDSLAGNQYQGSTTFTINNPGVLDHTESECQNARDDTTYIDIAVDGNNMILLWDTPMINCCVIPDWQGWLEGNVFHVTMTDQGPPCNCICTFTLTATFGPFAPGAYVLDFSDGYYGYPTFIIPGGGRDGDLFLGDYQSPCYELGAVEDRIDQSQRHVRLSQNYPNPFHPATTFAFQLPTPQAVLLQIFTPAGQLVETLVDRELSAGEHEFYWNAAGLANGVYLYRLQAGAVTETKKLILLKQ